MLWLHRPLPGWLDLVVIDDPLARHEPDADSGHPRAVLVALAKVGAARSHGAVDRRAIGELPAESVAQGAVRTPTSQPVRATWLVRMELVSERSRHRGRVGAAHDRDRALPREGLAMAVLSHRADRRSQHLLTHCISVCTGRPTCSPARWSASCGSRSRSTHFAIGGRHQPSILASRAASMLPPLTTAATRSPSRSGIARVITAAVAAAPPALGEKLGADEQLAHARRRSRRRRSARHRRRTGARSRS